LQDAATVSKESSTNLFPLLNEHERTLLQSQKDITDRSRALAHRVGITIPNDPNHSILQQLATFSVVVAGEYNAGKSSLINALVGEPRLLETGTLPTTDTIAILSASPPPKHWDNSVRFHHLPHNAFLQDLTLVDTPGTNAILTHHTAQTLRLLPAADWILFVTSADRPLSESERQLLESMAKEYRKSIVLVINKMDILDRAGGWHGAEEKQKVVDFVQTNVASLLGARPMVIPVSAHIPSQVAVLSQFLKETLSHHTKIQSKLTSPLGVAEKWVHQGLEQVTIERHALRDHAVILQLVQSHVEGWKKESKSEMELIRMLMGRYLRTQQGDRAHLFLQRLTVWQFYSLAFQLDPVAWDRTGPLASSSSSSSSSSRGKSNDQARDDLQQMAYEAASSLATKTRAQGQAVIELLGHRASLNAQTPFSLVGHITAASRFEETHDRIRERLQLVLQRTIHEEEKTGSYGDYFQRTLSRLAMTSIGWNMLCIASSIWYGELQGFMMATASVAAGTAVLFSGRSHAAQKYAQIWHTKADQLEQDLQTVWEEELERQERQIVQGISPFQRFVQAEEERLHELQTEAESILHASQKLRYQVSQPAKA
jgi:small GTP-binding protein